MRAALLLSIVASSLALSACGQDEDGVRAAFQQLRQAWLTEDYDGVCDLLTDAARREIGEIGHGKPRSCPADAATRMSATVLSRRDLAEPAIEEVDFDGNRATVLALLGGTTPAEVRFVEQDGEWRLDRVFGVTGPPPRDMR